MQSLLNVVSGQQDNQRVKLIQIFHCNDLLIFTNLSSGENVSGRLMRQTVRLVIKKNLIFSAVCHLKPVR